MQPYIMMNLINKSFLPMTTKSKSAYSLLLLLFSVNRRKLRTLENRQRWRLLFCYRSTTKRNIYSHSALSHLNHSAVNLFTLFFFLFFQHSVNLVLLSLLSFIFFLLQMNFKKKISFTESISISFLPSL